MELLMVKHEYNRIMVQKKKNEFECLKVIEVISDEFVMEFEVLSVK